MKDQNKLADTEQKTKNQNMKAQQEKFKVFELDFGDTNLLAEDKKVIIAQMESMIDDMKDEDELEFTVTIKRMTRRQINNIPEWS